MRGEGVSEEVPGHDLHMWRDVSAQALGEAAVDLDGGQGPPEGRQGNGEGAAAGADLDDRTPGRGDEVEDGVDDRGVDEEVLAVFVTAVSVGGHWLLRDRGGAGHA